MYQGQLVVGSFAGLSQRPWEFQGNSGITYKVGIQIGENVDDFGNVTPQVISVKLHKDDVSRFPQSVVDDLMGKQVYMQVRFDAKDGFNGPYCQPSMPKAGDFGLVTSLAKQLVTATEKAA